VNNRIQFSLQVEPIEDFDMMEKMQPIAIPTFWIEESIHLDESVTNMMRYGLYMYGDIIDIFENISKFFLLKQESNDS
jgi:CD36 family